MSTRKQGTTFLDRPPVPAALLLLALVAISFVTPAQAQQFDVPSSARSAIVDQTNAYRQEKGLAALSESAGASQEAQAYADYLAETTKTGTAPMDEIQSGGCGPGASNSASSAGRIGMSPGPGPPGHLPAQRWQQPCASGRNLPGMSALSDRRQRRSAWASPAGSTTISGTTKRSRCSSTPRASKAPRPRPTWTMRMCFLLSPTEIPDGSLERASPMR